MKQRIFLLILITLALLILSSCNTTKNSVESSFDNPTTPIIMKEDSIINEEGIKKDAPTTSLIEESTITSEEPIIEEEYPIVTDENTPIVIEIENKEEIKSDEIPIIEEELPPLKETETPLVIEEKPKEETSSEVSLLDSSSPLYTYNYAYGIKCTKEIEDEGISVMPSYFSRGILDAVSSNEPKLISYVEIDEAYSDYIVDYLYGEKTFEKGVRIDDNKALLALSTPLDTPSRFSYGYAFNIIRDQIDNYIEIIAEPFIKGVNDALYGETLPSESEIEALIDEFVIYLNERDYQSKEERSKENRELSSAFLSENSKRDGVTTLYDGIQLEILDEDETVGLTPSESDKVIADWVLYALDLRNEEELALDADFGNTIDIISSPYGLKRIITNMKEGTAVRGYIPPLYSPLDYEKEGIESESILIYDVALHKIL